MYYAKTINSHVIKEYLKITGKCSQHVEWKKTQDKISRT